MAPLALTCRAFDTAALTKDKIQTILLAGPERRVFHLGPEGLDLLIGRYDPMHCPHVLLSA